MSNTHGTSSGNQGNQKSDKNAPGHGGKDNQGAKVGQQDGGRKDRGEGADLAQQDKSGQKQQVANQGKGGQGKSDSDRKG